MRILWFGLLIGLLAACTHGDYVAARSFATGCWPTADSLSFAYTANGPDTPHFAIELELEASTFPYQNLYLLLACQGPGHRRDSLLLLDTLQDPLGNWKTTAMKGDRVTWQWRQPVAIDLPAAGTWTFALTQYMRSDTLCGIRRVQMAVLP